MPPSPETSGSPDPMPMRRLLSRPEAAILGGMVVVIFSLFLIWERKQPDGAVALQLGALRVASLTVSRDGFTAGVALPLTLCAVLCATTLLWEPNAQNRVALGAAAGAGALACVVLALTKFALLPGVLVGLAGGALLLFGAYDRYGRPPRSHDAT